MTHVSIATVALRHDLFVLTDEIYYEYFVYHWRRHVSPGLDGRRETGDGRRKRRAREPVAAHV